MRGVRYEARVVSTDAYYCHCRMCQRAFGHLSGIFFEVERENVEWERGEPAYYQSSKVARRGFCRECGTPLTFEYLELDELHLAVGSLDEPGPVQARDPLRLREHRRAVLRRRRASARADG